MSIELFVCAVLLWMVCNVELSRSSAHFSLCPAGFIKVLLYIAFMTIMIKVHTFPLFAIRPMYLAMR